MCETCTHHNNEALFCHSYDTSTAGWDGCNAHETYDEMVARIETTQMYCGEHDRYFPKDYKYCPYCGNETKIPIIVPQSSTGEV